MSTTNVIDTPPWLLDITAVMAGGSRIKLLRDQRGWSQEALARAVGISQVAIKKIEAGQTAKSRFLPDIARVLGVTLDELFDPPGNHLSLVRSDRPVVFNQNPFPGSTMPVYAAAEGGNGTIILAAEPIERVQRPYTLEDVPDAYAILITGESMVPAFRPGDVAWVNPRLSPMRESDAIFYSVNDVEGEAKASIKNLVRWTDDAWVVEQWNPARQFELPRSEWQRCHRVVGKFSRR